MQIGQVKTRYGVEVYVDIEMIDGYPSVFVHVKTSEHAPTHVFVDDDEVYA